MTITSGGATRRYVYDANGRVLGEYGTSANDVRAEFIWMSPDIADNNPFGGQDGTGGYAPLAVASGSGASTSLIWVHGNHLGVPLTYSDASGTPVPPGTWSLPGFPGQSRTLADLYYNRYRDYDSGTGRHIQADPIGLDGDANPYVYAGANPVNRVDPMGLEFYDFLDNSPEQRALARKMRKRYDQLSARDRERYLVVAAHGTDDKICRNGGSDCHTAEAFKSILASENLLSHNDIILYACNTGRAKKGFAYQLASLLPGKTIIAPTALTWWNSEGLIGIYPRTDRRIFGSKPVFGGKAIWDPGHWRGIRAEQSE